MASQRLARLRGSAAPAGAADAARAGAPARRSGPAPPGRRERRRPTLLTACAFAFGL